MKLSSKQKVWAVGICALVVIACVVIWWLFKSAVSSVATYQQERVLKFSYELANTTNKALKNVEFSTYLPVVETSNQSSGDVITDEAFSLESSLSGNRVGKFNVDLIPPFGKKNVTYTAVIKTSEQANSLRLEDTDRYLEAEKFIESDADSIAALAATLRADTDLESAKNIFNWVSSRLKDSGYTSQDKGALHALKTLKGDCTEHMYLTIALARALGIPSRGIGGFVYKKSKVASAADYHNWAELYIDGAWVILDTQKKSFLENTQDYLAMRVISSSALSLLGSSHRFLVATDGIKVLMK